MRPSGFYKPLGLRFLILFRLCSFARSLASFGLGTHSTSPLVSCLIGEPLADDAGQDLIGAALIVHAQRHTMIVPEIELRKIAMQVLFGAMLISAAHAALENREVAFDSVGVDFAANVLTLAMIDRVMLGDLIQQASVNPAFVGMNAGLLIEVPVHDLGNGRLVRVLDME